MLLSQNKIALTSVPIKRGDFVNAHAVKWLLCSARVRTPLPFSNISGFAQSEINVWFDDEETKLPRSLRP